MPPAPSSASASGSCSGSSGSSAGLKSSSGSSFNRDLAKSCILGKLPSAKLANASINGSGSGSTGHKLLETLTSLRLQAAADKENAGCKTSSNGGMQKIGSARRVPINGKEGATPAITPTAAAAAVATAAAAEKAALTQQLESLRSQLAQLEQTLREKDATNSKLLTENELLKTSQAAHAQELSQARATIEQLQQQNKALLVQNAGKPQEPTATTVPSAANAAMFAALTLAADEPTVALPTKQAQAPAASQESQNESDDEDDDDIVFGGAADQDEDNEEEEEVTAALTVARQAAANCDTPIKDGAAAAAAAPAPAAAAVTSIVAAAADELDLTIPEPAAAASTASPASPACANNANASLNLSSTSSTASPFNHHATSGSTQLPASFLSNPASPATFLSPISSRSPPAKAEEEDEAAATTAIAATALPAVIAYGAPASMLSQSALKIQARFRGHMERSYVARHEARLAALPLTSPSTPLRGAATPGESPLPKRQRVSASPVSSKCAMLLEEEAEEAGLLDARELSFQIEETEEENMSMGVAVPVVTASASAAAAPSRIPSLLNTSASASAASASSSSSALLPLTPASPSASTFLTLADQKRFVSELRAQRPTLGTIDACWTLRSKAMNRVEALVRDRGAGGLAGFSGWAQELTGLQRALGAQLADLRSSILREACRLLIALSEASPRDFEDQLAFYAPLLWKGLYVTIKVISSTSDETMAELVARVATVKSVPVVRINTYTHARTHTHRLRTGTHQRHSGRAQSISDHSLTCAFVCTCVFDVSLCVQFLSCLSDVHSVVREKCAAYLLQIVSSSGDREGLEVYLAALSAAFKSQTQDQDGKVRAAWRALFEGVARIFPAQMDALYNDLPQPVQKAFEMDRKAKLAAAGKAGAKRKK